MSAKGYKIINLKETTPSDTPDAGFLYLFPFEGNWWLKNSDGELKQISSVDFNQISNSVAWEDDVEYSREDGNDVYVIDESLLYKLSSTTSLNEKPSENPLVWEEIDLSKMAHPKNNDLKLGVFKKSLLLGTGGGTQTFILTLGAYKTFNWFILDQGAQAPATFPISLRTNSGSGNFISHPFFVQAGGGVGNVFTFSNDDNQYIGAETLELETRAYAWECDWAIFQHMGGKTILIASNKLQGAGGSSGNPFNQSLNTSDNVAFNSVTISSRAGTGERAATYDADGKMNEKGLVDINAAVLTEINLYDEILDDVVKYKSVNGVLIAVS